MNDLLDLATVAALLVMLVLVVAPPAGIAHWAREAWRVKRGKAWENDYLVNPALGTAKDRHVARTIVRQRALGKRMRRQGRSLLAKKPYIPVLSKAAATEPPPPLAAKVISIRQSREHRP